MDIVAPGPACFELALQEQDINLAQLLHNCQDPADVAEPESTPSTLQQGAVAAQT